MIWLAQDQTIVVAKSTWIRVLSLQLDTIRLSVKTETSLHVVPCQTGHDVTLRVTLAALRGNTAGLDVDAPGASSEQSCTKLDPQDQSKTACNLSFVTLRVGECIAFAETSKPAATPTELE